MVNVRHHSIRFGRVLLVCILILIVIVLFALALEPVLRLGMFLDVVARRLPASGG